MPDQQKKFYLTTPIYYVNARPHIGHAYTTIAADVLARRHRLLGEDVFFLTGTDEHGQKIERSAAAAGIPPQQFADEVAASFEALWKRMGITNDKFIRTTSAEHKRGVQKLFRKLKANGFIYPRPYTGQYCISDETFVDVPPGAPCPECGRPTETVTEENYYFRLSRFQRPLIELIESGELVIEPEARRSEVLSFLRGNVPAAQRKNDQLMGKRLSDEMQIAASRKAELNQEFLQAVHKVQTTSMAHSFGPMPPIERFFIHTLALTYADLCTRSDGKDTNRQVVLFKEDSSFVEGTPNGGPQVIKESSRGNPYVEWALNDLSISRSSFKWGVPVPDDPNHVIYVWLDALTNYMSAVGYGSDAPEDVASFEKYWPADLHLVGKEIIRFHCVYWPAFLLAAGLPLPKKIQAHGWLLFEESKMSKSRGNIVRTETILDAFGEHYRKELTRLGQPEPDKGDCDLFAADVLRYFLLREIPFGQDGSFSFDALIIRYNADLANGYGNLVSRTLKMVEQICLGGVPSHRDWGMTTIILSDQGAAGGVRAGLPDPNQFVKVPDADLAGHAAAALFFYEPAFRSLNFALPTNEGLRKSMKAGVLDSAEFLISEADGLLTRKAPWKLAKSEEPTDKEIVSNCLYEVAESIRIITAMLYPIMPHTTAKVWAQLGLGDIEQAACNGELKDLKWGGLKPGRKLGALAPIFPRAPKELAQVMADMEAQNNPATPKSGDSGASLQNDASTGGKLQTGGATQYGDSSATPQNDKGVRGDTAGTSTQG
ncbi:MAG TPA: class I tRNA ligase family protein, partial [Acidobacteriaceae bacterium]|nr:class I tRNA ligase family protein [Acidobacteriaceae bacterium]